MNNNEEREVIHSMFTQNTFVKVKQSLEIGKILFSFVDTQNKTNIDCYMSAEEFGALLMQDVKNGSIFKKLAAEKAKGEQYPKEVWTSPVGGSNKGGNPVSRYFTIAPGAKAEVVITATQSLATQNETGAFIPIKGSKATIIRVGCKYNDLRLLQYKWSFLEDEYMRSKYNMAAMKSSYRQTDAVPAIEHTISKPQTVISSPQIDNDKISLNFVVKSKGKVVSNGMKQYNIEAANKPGRLFVRPEDAALVPDIEGTILTFLCQKKGDDYLLISSQ